MSSPNRPPEPTSQHIPPRNHRRTAASNIGSLAVLGALAVVIIAVISFCQADNDLKSAPGPTSSQSTTATSTATPHPSSGPSTEPQGGTVYFQLNTVPSVPQLSYDIASRMFSDSPKDFAVECRNPSKMKTGCMVDGRRVAQYTILPNAKDRAAKVALVEPGDNFNPSTCLKETNYSPDWVSIYKKGNYCVQVGDIIAAIHVVELPIPQVGQPLIVELQIIRVQ
jgi:hypothetical protein